MNIKSRISEFSHSEKDNIILARELNRIELRKVKVSDTIRNKREAYSRKALKYDDSRVSTSFKEFNFLGSTTEEVYLVLKKMLSSGNTENIKYALSLIIESLQSNGRIPMLRLLEVFSSYDEILDFILSYVMTIEDTDTLVSPYINITLYRMESFLL